MKTVLRNRLLKFIWIILILILVSGCWDAKELAKLAIVSAVGIDQADQPERLLITIQIIKPSEVKSGGGGGSGEGGGGEGQKKGGQQAFVIAQSTGKTVAEAFRNFAFQLNRELYLSQNQIIIFGKELATKGVRPLFDYFIRSREVREIAWILIARGQASDLLKTPPKMEKISAIEIADLLTHSTFSSKAAGITQHEFVNRLMSKTAAPYASMIEVTGEPQRPQLIGIAAFKSDKYIGQLDKNETRGFLWVIGKVVRGIITVNSQEAGQIDFEVLKAKSKIMPELGFGKLNLKIEIIAQCRLSSVTIPVDLTRRDNIEKLENLLNQAVRKEIIISLAKARQLDSDIFGFGEAIHRKYPKEWKMLEPKWDQTFLSLPIKLVIKAKLTEFGMNDKPVIPQ